APRDLPSSPTRRSSDLGALLAAAVCVLYWWILNHTSPGHRLRLYGHNPDFAAASGTSRRRYEMHIALAAGAVSGLAGGIQVLGRSEEHTSELQSRENLV